MKVEQEYADDLANEYIRDGWRVEDPRLALPVVDFQPDLLLRRGDKYLVVEINQPGVRVGRSIAATRRRVERQPNWHFEVKLLPPQVEFAARGLATGEIQRRLTLAEDLLREGNHSDAVMMAWLVIETSLRMASGANGTEAPAAVPDLLRAAYEAETISDSELRQLLRGLALRNQIVHGFSVRLSESETHAIVALARELVGRVSGAPH